MFAGVRSGGCGSLNVRPNTRRDADSGEKDFSASVVRRRLRKGCASERLVESPVVRRIRLWTPGRTQITRTTPMGLLCAFAGPVLTLLLPRRATRPGLGRKSQRSRRVASQYSNRAASSAFSRCLPWTVNFPCRRLQSAPGTASACGNQMPIPDQLCISRCLLVCAAHWDLATAAERRDLRGIVNMSIHTVLFTPACERR